MEQHPVPQNVTTFQFRLIGDMTLKQFGYLCAGAILAFISYKLPLPLVITWPLAASFALLGIGFAFVPVEERPMDVWVFSFFKSIYSPTQYVWQREPPPPPSPVTKPRQKEAKGTTPQLAPSAAATAVHPPAATTPRMPSPTKERVANLFVPSSTATYPQVTTQTITRHDHTGGGLFDTFLAFFRGGPKTVAPPKSAATQPPPPSVTGKKPPPEEKPLPTPQPALQPTAEAQGRITQLEAALKQLERQLAEKTAGETRITELQKQLTSVLSEKETIQQELVNLRRKLGATTKSPEPPSSHLPQAVKVITTPDLAVKAGLPRLTSFPNVVTGIIKDTDGNLLPGILVTILDREGVPVRALKTNKLGQFAASTPLPNNTYVVEVEDPRSRFVFARVQITLNGNVMPALEIIAKSQKEVTREKLAQQIFGDQT